MTSTERIAKLMADNRILENEMTIKSHVAEAEQEELLNALGQAVENLYKMDMEVINNV